MKQKQLTIKSRWLSLGYAVNGIRTFFNEEANAWIHLLATLWVITGSFMLGVSKIEALALVFVTGLVWVMEIFNTAVERLVDFISPHHHFKAGRIKDLAAASVLVASVIACLTGLIIFIPKILAL